MDSGLWVDGTYTNYPVRTRKEKGGWCLSTWESPRVMGWGWKEPFFVETGE